MPVETLHCPNQGKITKTQKITDSTISNLYLLISTMSYLQTLWRYDHESYQGPSRKKTLISEQAGFRPGKSCTGQILNLCQHIEDNYENKNITGVVFVNLSAACDIVIHNLLLKKIYEWINDWHLIRIISSMLHNRRFAVPLNNKWSRWRNQRNGLP